MTGVIIKNKSLWQNTEKVSKLCQIVAAGISTESQEHEQTVIIVVRQYYYLLQLNRMTQ